jgi:endonuclease I
MKMKKIYSILLVIVSQFCFSQIPMGYYSSATGTGYVLKTQLKTIISNDNIVTGSTGYGNLWTLYDTQLRDTFAEYDNDGSLFDIYSEKPGGGNNDPYNFTSTAQQDSGSNCAEGGCYNREHLIPQSYFDKHALYPMRNDAHHVVPSDKVVNGERGNFPFGKVSTATYTSQNGSKKGNNLNSGYSIGYSSTVFEPLDDFKGDVARSFFYFATRYEDNMDEFYTTTSASTECKAMFDGSIDKVFSATFLNILLTWNLSDPVSAKEIAFNNKIYAYQGNRNPFIDNNSYVTSIWGLPLGKESFNLASTISVFPNPSNESRIYITTENILDTIVIINVNGQIIQQIKNPKALDNQYTLENLPKGFYFLKVSSDNNFATKKIIIN